MSREFQYRFLSILYRCYCTIFLIELFLKINVNLFLCIACLFPRHTSAFKISLKIEQFDTKYPGVISCFLCLEFIELFTYMGLVFVKFEEISTYIFKYLSVSRLLYFPGLSSYTYIKLLEALKNYSYYSLCHILLYNYIH